jgi:hypothetical protein
MRKIVKVDIEPCGCYVQRITEDWMGDIITYDNPVICSDCW